MVVLESHRKSGKKRAKRRLVPAGQSSTLVDGRKPRPMPHEGMYSKETNIYSPMSRGF